MKSNFIYKAPATQASGSAQYLMAEDLKSGAFTLPSLWTDEHLSVILAGSPMQANSQYCLQLPATGAWRDFSIPNAQSELFAFFPFRITPALPAAQTNMFNFQTSAAATQLQINLNADGTVNLTHGATSVTTTGALVANTIYNVWVHYKAGSGANGVGSIGFNTTETEPASGNMFASTSTGTATLSVQLFDPENTSTAANFNFQFGKMRLSNARIGSNPA